MPNWSRCLLDAHWSLVNEMMTSLDRSDQVRWMGGEWAVSITRTTNRSFVAPLFVLGTATEIDSFRDPGRFFSVSSCLVRLSLVEVSHPFITLTAARALDLDLQCFRLSENLMLGLFLSLSTSVEINVVERHEVETTNPDGYME